ncbi:Lrp/AsnC family transcriptional regulator [Microbacterium bovistercoris]|uniref:Lrp/AsnC family transcriptional regulator n=1 Tax=Microbacterium bovistercoris TaxID=2293570 RepID=A0A371NNZ6_9MICO|nr:Lrp/AsnC family transcriptional regulator [Microbacterium bovistercoris]REJ03888.1 Lrp/AsnC family transcriptional regulator [Microbacterium bovistercoris]
MTADSTTPRRIDRDVDDLDGRLIHALQQNGRASIQDLAQRLDAPRDYVSQRLHRLIEHGGLRVIAALDPGFAGHHVLVHAMVTVSGPARPVADEIARIDDAVFVSMVSGAHPLVFESRHGDDARLHEMLDRVRRISAVRQVRVTTYAEVLKGFFVAESRTEIALDELDHLLISALQGDGRESYRALADAVHLSPSSARSRVRRLIDAGVIRISAIPSGGLSRNRVAVGVGITLSDDAEPVRQYILDSPVIEFAARTHGSYDFIVTIGASSTAGALTVLEEIRALPQVGGLETWTHLDVIKEDYARSLGRVLA